MIVYLIEDVREEGEVIRIIDRMEDLREGGEAVIIVTLIINIDDGYSLGACLLEAPGLSNI